MISTYGGLSILTAWSDRKMRIGEILKALHNTVWFRHRMQHEQSDFRERATIFDHTVPNSVVVPSRGVLSPPHTPREGVGLTTQDHARSRDSNAAQGNIQDMEATLPNLFRKECQGCSEVRRPSRPAPHIQSSGASVTSQPWIQLTGGYARWTRSRVLVRKPPYRELMTR